MVAAHPSAGDRLKETGTSAPVSFNVRRKRMR